MSVCFNSLFVVLALENPLHVNAGRVDIRIQFAGRDELLDFSDRDAARGRDHRIEIARGLAKNEISHRVALPGFDDGEIRGQRTLQNVFAPVELANVLALGDHRSISCRRVKRRNPRTARAKFFRQGSLRRQLDFELAGHEQLLEKFVLANVAGNHLFDLALFEHQTDAESVDARVVGNAGQILHAFFNERRDAVLGNSAEAEAAQRQGCAIRDVLTASRASFTVLFMGSPYLLVKYCVKTVS